MRIIEQFVQAMLSIVQSRKNGNYKEAVEKIQTASRCYLRTDIELLLQYTPEQIAAFFSDENKNLDRDRCIICADLLKELSLIFEAQKHEDVATNLKSTSRELYRLANHDVETA